MLETEIVKETETKWVNPADFFPVRGVTRARVKTLVFGDPRMGEGVEIQKRMRDRRLRVKKIIDEREKNAVA